MTRLSALDCQTAQPHTQTPTFSRRVLRPSFALLDAPSQLRAQGRPGADRTRGGPSSLSGDGQRKVHEQGHVIRPSPRNGLNGLCRGLPGETGFLATLAAGVFVPIPSGWTRSTSCGLTPSGRRDFTILPDKASCSRRSLPGVHPERAFAGPEFDAPFCVRVLFLRSHPTRTTIECPAAENNAPTLSYPIASPPAS